jgi:hypothetical protein
MAPLIIGGLEVPWIDAVRPEDTRDMPPYIKQTRRTDILPKGWQKEAGKRLLDCDIIYDQNIVVTLRDGVKVPTHAKRIAIVLRHCANRANRFIVTCCGP